MASDSEGDARQRIVSAAYHVVCASGPTLISMRQVAQRAGVSVGTVSYHFPDKGALLEECLDELYSAFDAVWDSMKARVAETGAVEEVASDFIGAWFDMLHANRNLVRLRVLLAMDHGEVPRERVRDHLVRYVDEVASKFTVAPRTLRMRFHAVHVLIVRHCAMSIGEWCDLTGTQDVEEAASRMREHLVDVCLGILDVRERE